VNRLYSLGGHLFGQLHNMMDVSMITVRERREQNKEGEIEMGRSWL
jgi:hypothetical protein